MPVVKNESDLSPEQIAALLSYEPETGIFTWKVRRGPKALAGSRAGFAHRLGYRYIKLCGISLSEHRLAWYMVHGEWPELEIDHINQVKDDNRIANLRKATRRQNQVNIISRKSNRSGHTGVFFHKATNKWAAFVMQGNRKRHLGVFSTVQEAAEARSTAVKANYGVFAPASAS